MINSSPSRPIFWRSTFRLVPTFRRSDCPLERGATTRLLVSSCRPRPLASFGSRAMRAVKACGGDFFQPGIEIFAAVQPDPGGSPVKMAQTKNGNKKTRLGSQKKRFTSLEAGLVRRYFWSMLCPKTILLGTSGCIPGQPRRVPVSISQSSTKRFVDFEFLEATWEGSRSNPAARVPIGNGSGALRGVQKTHGCVRLRKVIRIPREKGIPQSNATRA